MDQNKLINTLVTENNNSVNWFAKLQEIPIINPVKNPTRPNISKKFKWGSSGNFYNIKINDSDNSENEPNIN